MRCAAEGLAEAEVQAAAPVVEMSQVSRYQPLQTSLSDILTSAVWVFHWNV